VIKIAMSFEFVSGSIPRPAKRIAHWPELPETRDKTFCGDPSFYASCDVFKVEPGNRGLGNDQEGMA
jgi:hypothetical protein